jgi:pyrimidine-nucleoside phosphorylase
MSPQPKLEALRRPGSRRSAPKNAPNDLSPVGLIAKKRDGGEHTDHEIQTLVDGFLSGQVADYQMSAWLMAAYLRGLSPSEMRALTKSMLESGKLLHLPKVRATKVDKHSTGGVGDKISLPLAPLVAEAGLAVPMISGRGLGHTGGTLDKLESIPGFRVHLSAKEFERIVARVGCAIMGQTAELAPADKRIYALRDVTGTVACRPLIVASILSKKIAAGLDGLVLDVKVGRGAFMKDRASAEALARDLVETASALGTKAEALLTRMDAPLGRTVGNALEVAESIEILRGDGPKDVTDLTIELGAEMLVLGGLEKSQKAAQLTLRKLLQSGKALERFERMVEAQGGDPRIIASPNRLPHVTRPRDLTAPKRGWVSEIDSFALGEVAVLLGAGRRRAQDIVDPRVGFEIMSPCGSEVSRGEPLLRVHTGKIDLSSELEKRLIGAFRIRPEKPKLDSSLVLSRVSVRKRK